MDAEAHAMERTEISDSPSPTVTSSILLGADLADLARIYESEIMLVSAPIPPSAAAVRFAQALAASDVRQSSVQVTTENGIPQGTTLDELANGIVDGAPAWVAYLTEVTALFAELFDARLVGVRQIVTDGPHCPRFHLDRVHARGVLNVLGACTEWLDEPDVDRSKLGHAGGDDDTASGLVHDWSRLCRAGHGALTVFKGTAWPGAEERAIVHRSPPGDGTRRLVLTLDWME